MKPPPTLDSGELRRRAETRLRKRRKGLASPSRSSTAAVDAQQLVHELQVHQVELELQNAELQETRNRTELLLEKLTELYDFAPVGYFTLSADGTIQRVNLTGATLVGVERSKLVGKPLRLLISPGLRPALDTFLRSVFSGQTSRSSDFELLSKEQPPRTVNIEAQCSPDGQECRAAVVDVTDRKRAEDQIRVSEVRYRRLFEAAHDGVLLLDPASGKITDANPFMTRLLGYPHEQLVGKELYEIGLLKDEAASREMFRKLRRKREIRYEDLPLKSEEGRHLEVEVVANLYQENGHSVIQCNIRDITQRKQAEEMLRRNQALFSTLVAQAPVGVYVVDDHLRLQQVNPRARPAFEKIHPLIGRDISEIIQVLWPKRVADHIVERFRHTLKTGEPYRSNTFAERRRDIGLKEYYEWQLERINLPAGESGVVCFFNNITERKRAEGAQRRMDALSASNRRLEKEIVRRQRVEQSLKKSERHQSMLLEHSSRMQEQLRRLSRQVLRAQEEERKRISRELHDVIAQTLTGINIQLAALKKEAAVCTKGLDRKIAMTQRLVEQSVEIVHQFARELRPTVLDDLGLIPALHAFMEAFFARTGVRASLTAFAGVEKLGPAQRTVLYRVAQEALTNVARHAHASQVGVCIQKLPDGIRMTVKDDGKSFRVDHAWDVKGGERLGLLGMRERVEMIGGKFGVESAPGQGTTIFAQIPQATGGARKTHTNH